MREDMYKVIVERPRRWKGEDARAARLRNDLDGPMSLGMRAGYGCRELNENLSPLRRYLHRQVGRPWNNVFSEVCACIDRRNTVQQHIHQHIRNFIAIDVDVRDGRLVDLAARPGFLGRSSGIFQELYVDPRTGLIRHNRDARSSRHRRADHRKRELAQMVMRRRVVDERTFLLLLDGIWFRVQTDVLPAMRVAIEVVDGKPHQHTAADRRYDVVLRRFISRAIAGDQKQCEYLYGSADLYAQGKRQLSRREIKAHELRSGWHSGFETLRT